MNTTHPTFTPEWTLNEIVAQWPQALPILQQFGFDTCCGGALPLKIVAERHDLSLESVLAALREVVEIPQ